MVGFAFGLALGTGITLTIGIFLIWRIKNAITRGTESTVKGAIERICTLPLCEDCKRSIG
jgi:hypothetical protein